MNNYDHILNALKFYKVSENYWRLDNVLDNDIANYTTCEGKNDGLRYYIYAPDEPPASKYITVRIDTLRERLDIHFDHGDSGNCTRGMPLAFFEGIFQKLLEDRRDFKINKIIDK